MKKNKKKEKVAKPRKKFSLLNEKEREFICKLSLKDAINFLKTIY